MTSDELDVRRRIAVLVDAVEADVERSDQLFQYVWTMICVRRGLMRVVSESHDGGTIRLEVEEVTSGRRHLVVRPPELDSEIEGLAVEALASLMAETKRAS